MYIPQRDHSKRLPIVIYLCIFWRVNSPTKRNLCTYFKGTSQRKNRKSSIYIPSDMWPHPLKETTQRDLFTEYHHKKRPSKNLFWEKKIVYILQRNHSKRLLKVMYLHTFRCVTSPTKRDHTKKPIHRISLLKGTVKRESCTYLKEITESDLFTCLSTCHLTHEKRHDSFMCVKWLSHVYVTQSCAARAAWPLTCQHACDIILL